VWWIAIIIAVDELQNEVEVKFMSPHGPGKYFKRPSREDIRWVTLQQILCVIRAPLPAMISKKNYRIEENDFECCTLRHFHQ